MDIKIVKMAMGFNFAVINDEALVLFNSVIKPPTCEDDIVSQSARLINIVDRPYRVAFCSVDVKKFLDEKSEDYVRAQKMLTLGIKKILMEKDLPSLKTCFHNIGDSIPPVCEGGSDFCKTCMLYKNYEEYNKAGAK